MLGAVMVVGWGLVWRFANQRPQPAEPVARAEPKPEPVVADHADEFETVTDRTPMSFRDNAAYAYLLEKARKLTPAELAAQSRRDILLTHLWERPELYRGVPIHLLGTARRVLRYRVQAEQDGLALRGLDRHAGRQPVIRTVASSRKLPTAFPWEPTCPSALSSTATSSRS